MTISLVIHRLGKSILHQDIDNLGRNPSISSSAAGLIVQERPISLRLHRLLVLLVLLPATWHLRLPHHLRWIAAPHAGRMIPRHQCQPLYQEWHHTWKFISEGVQTGCCVRSL